MKFNNIGQYLLWCGLCWFPFTGKAQISTIKLATGEQRLAPASSETALRVIKESAGYEGRYYWIAQFAIHPGISLIRQWEKEGFLIQAKLAPQTYLVSSNLAPTVNFNQKHQIGQASAIDPGLKISRALKNGRFFNASPDLSGRIPILVAAIPGISTSNIKSKLIQEGYQPEPGGMENKQALTLRASREEIISLAALPFIQYIQPVAKDNILNEKARLLSGAFRANASMANGGSNLNGSGVVIGIGDDADPSFHPDLADRVINRTPGLVNQHGAHVSGTVAGGGVLQPDRRGVASKATIINQLFNGIWLNAASYIQDFGMVLTNNSYSATEADCQNNGVYDLYSQMLDEQAMTYTQLLHVFAAGNSGDDVCTPLPQHYNTIMGGYQPAKNVITVGRTDYNLLSSGSSSSGPVWDGRLKPEITSLGIVESTNATNGYFGAYGTSQSAPAVTGGLALLYERYRQLFGGANPEGALIKSAILNGARDIGNPGPDYRHGYGFIHLENSLRILNNHQYVGGKLAQGETKDTVISVPAGTAILKVLLYWHDPPASPLAANTLMNDLDLEVILPDGSTIIYPKKLNPLNPGNPATEGTDHINNSEQVVIPTPLPGNYTIRVKGYEILSTPDQSFYATYDFVPAGLFLRTPVKGDNWSVSSPDEFGITGVMISWDDEGTPTGTYSLEYSLDNGVNWTTIVDNLAGADRYYGWRPPAATATTQARIRITKNNTAFSDTSETFTILNRPAYSIQANPCEGYIKVNWTAVTGADDYEVMMKQGPQMVPVAVVAPPQLTYTISGLHKDTTYYVAVRARKNGISGRWNQARPTTPNSGTCAGTISDGDLKLDSITSPVFGRQFTSKNLGTAENIKFRIKNLDNIAVPAGMFQVKYSVDGGPFQSQAGTASIPALGTYVHTVSGVDLSALGTHIIRGVVENKALVDKVPNNDTFTLIVKNLPNDPVVLTAGFMENFDVAPVFSVQKNTNGLPGLDRWDYYTSDKYGRIRSFVNTGIASSGQRAITLDASKATPYVKDPSNNFEGTFNLSSYTVADDIRVDFLFKQHGNQQLPGPQNKVWIRGSDTGNWVEAYDLGVNQPVTPGIWKRSHSIELSDLLKAANPVQQYSTSTQLKFGQYALFGMADNSRLAGLSFDDFRLYIAENDLQLIAIDTPGIYSCGLNNQVPIKVTVRNSSNQAINGVQVSYSINGGGFVSETIPGPIAAKGSLGYQFMTPANLSTAEKNTIEVIVAYPGDNVPENNKSVVVVNNQPLISTFPYLENFESGTGGYFVSGKNASWEYGTPGSIKINPAASGTNAWKTRLRGGYNDEEFSQLNTPCFDISTLSNPMLSFSLAYDLEDCSPYGIVCDAAWVEYSNDGINWTKLGAAGQGTNWYDNVNNRVWSKRNQTHWHVASIPLPKGSNSLRLRFVMASDDFTNYEGIAIDDIHIYDLPGPIYTNTGTSNPINLPVAGSDPVHFKVNGNLVASLFPNNNNLGDTEIKAYHFNGPVRNNLQQYYGNRNITIKPANSFGGSATVRFYFSDKEVDSMRLANTCTNCPNPKDYTRLGITQYTDANKSNEDGDLSNNSGGTSNFIYGNQLVLVPYESGYYAEFNVSQFSEFWINDGRGTNLPLPGKWLSFNAVKQGGDQVKLSWVTSNEVEIRHYEIQVATSKEAFASNQFSILGISSAKNTPQADYSFIDNNTGKAGDYFYRVKQVDNDGKSFYSPVVLVQFSIHEFEVKMYPNPVKENLVLAIKVLGARQFEVKVFDMAGKLLFRQNCRATSGSSQHIIPFQQLGIKDGLYTISLTDGKSWWYGKVMLE